jgi:hypothetical protein
MAPEDNVTPHENTKVNKKLTLPLVLPVLSVALATLALLLSSMALCVALKDKNDQAPHWQPMGPPPGMNQSQGPQFNQGFDDQRPSKEFRQERRNLREEKMEKFDDQRPAPAEQDSESE